MDCLVRNIPENHQYVNYTAPVNVKIIKKKLPNEPNLIINTNQIYKKPINQPVELLKKYLDLLNPKRADDYVSWITIGMALHNCNPTEKCFKLWDTWSKQSPEYESRDFNAYKWNSFKFGC